MRNILYLICFSLFSHNTLYCQSRTFQSDFTAVYQLSFVPDSLSPANIKQEYAELLIKGDSSIFRTIAHGNIDSAINNGAKDSFSLYLANRTDISYTIEKIGDCVTYFDCVYDGFNEFFYYHERISDQAWEILDESLTIEGILCQKAKLKYGNRDWIAYFAPSYPFFVGPYKFAGLPGLIISVEDASSHWKFRLISLEKNSRTVSYTDSRFVYSQTEKEAFLKQRKKVRDNAFEIETASGANEGVDVRGLSKIKEFYQKRAKADNNWIELFP